MKRFLKAFLIVLLVLAAAAGGVLYSAMGGRSPIVDGKKLAGVEVVKDSFVSIYILETGPREVVLVDSGNDKEGKALLAALGRRGLGPEAVKAILLTHGDGDHTAGAHLFPRATVMALAPDVALAEGRAVRMPIGSPHPTGLHVTRELKDGETLSLGAARVAVFAIPGHTPGSVALLASGVLFLGDSAEGASDGRLEPSNWLFCSDRPTNRASLRGLAKRLAPRAAEVKAIAPSHSGILERGLAPLKELAASL
jgi:hydroxyacylglutathione hydrolase